MSSEPERSNLPDDRPLQGPAPPSVEHQEILDEIETLQKGRTSWTSGILTLLVSVALFFALGMASWSWTTTVTLIVILLFHESGHALAMWIFRYRNLRMFFIPLFGAAVSGRNYNVAGWKKTIVSLAGPLPGIAVGAILGSVAMILDNEFLLDAALMAVGLNGFNLLPVLPLDGGWVMHALLFSRHPLFDALFRGVAAVVLLMSAFLGLWILAALGGFMLLGIPFAYRSARIASRLRDSGLISVSPDGQSIPVASAQMIVDEVKTDFPSVKQNTAIARLVLQVFEAVNARPPGWLATFALGGLYGASFLAAIVFSIVFYLGKVGDSGSGHPAKQPRYAFNCGSTLAWEGKAYSDDHEPERNTIVASFASRGEAETDFQRLSREFPQEARAGLFGHTLLLELPENESVRDEWASRLRSVSNTVFVDSLISRTSFTVICIAPNEEVGSVSFKRTRPGPAFPRPSCSHASGTGSGRSHRAIATRGHNRQCRRAGHADCEASENHGHW